MLTTVPNREDHAAALAYSDPSQRAGDGAHPPLEIRIGQDRGFVDQGQLPRMSLCVERDCFDDAEGGHFGMSCCLGASCTLARLTKLPKMRHPRRQQHPRLPAARRKPRIKTCISASATVFC